MGPLLPIIDQGNLQMIMVINSTIIMVINEQVNGSKSFLIDELQGLKA